MQRILTDTGLFQSGNPEKGMPGTIVTATWLNAVQEEICNIIVEAGLELNTNDSKQLFEAVKALLKKRADEHENAMNPHRGSAPVASPNFTGVPRAPTASRGTNTTQIATTAYVRDAIAALVDGAPATLDTLAEIANALGRDQNLRTTLLNEISKKANAASPVLTGIPQAPTPDASTSNNQIATTKFVKDAIAALVGNAPATLDTLAEIANALGSDQNLRTTLLNQIVAANNNANRRVSKSGDTMSGHLTIEANSDYSSLRTRNSSNDETRWESHPRNNAYFFAKLAHLVDGQHRYGIGFPKKTGTVALVEDFTYQKIGNFEIRRYPDGTMIQTYKHKNPKGTTNNHRTLYQFNWAVSFTATPLVWVTQSSDANTNSQAENDHVSASINSYIKINHFKSSGGVCAYWDFNVEGDGNGREMNWDFLAIGRWK